MPTWMPQLLICHTFGKKGWNAPNCLFSNRKRGSGHPTVKKNVHRNYGQLMQGKGMQTNWKTTLKWSQNGRPKFIKNTLKNATKLPKMPKAISHQEKVPKRRLWLRMNPRSEGDKGEPSGRTLTACWPRWGRRIITANNCQLHNHINVNVYKTNIPW